MKSPHLNIFPRLPLGAKDYVELAQRGDDEAPRGGVRLKPVPLVGSGSGQPERHGPRAQDQYQEGEQAPYWGIMLGLV